MTSVIGHLNMQDFDRQYSGWASCPPSVLFDAEIHDYVDPVCGFFQKASSSDNDSTK